MMDSSDWRDWRLQGQERFLEGVDLCRRAYRRYAGNREWDHDHCAFCWTEFAVEDRPEVLHAGFCTLDEYHWICEACFHDFKARFQWRIVPAE